MMPQRLFIAVLCGVVLTACGCNPPPLELSPLTGTIHSADDKPITAGGLIFMPDSGSWGGNVVNASINPDGTFTSNTSRMINGRTEMISGAPTGRYKVVYHPPGDGQALGLETEFPEIYTVETGGTVLKLVLPEKKSPAKPETKKGEPAADKPTGDR